jgi:hypothetical protein
MNTRARGEVRRDGCRDLTPISVQLGVGNHSAILVSRPAEFHRQPLGGDFIAFAKRPQSGKHSHVSNLIFPQVSCIRPFSSGSG